MYSRIAGYSRITGAASDAAYGQESQRRALRGAGVAPGAYPGGSSPQVIQDDGGPLRYFPMGFFAAAVGKSAAVDVTTKAQVVYRGSRLVLPGELTPAAPIGNPFKLRQIQVGQRNQFVASVQLGSFTFAPDAVGVALSLDTASVGMDLVLSVTNSDTLATHDFEASLLGDCQLVG